jgi:hypothetical protein
MTWRDSSATLDWTDVARTIREIEKAYSAVCTFTVSQLGEQYAHRFYVEVLVSVPILTGAGQLLSVETYSEWPDGRHETMESLVYSLLLQADYTMARETKQLTLEA